MSAPPRAGEMDRALHGERLCGRAKRLHRASIDDLPDGAFVAMGGKAFAVRGGRLLPWTADGYGASVERPRRIAADVLTPPSAVAVLAAGYRPRWHPTAA